MDGGSHGCELGYPREYKVQPKRRERVKRAGNRTGLIF